MTQPQPGSPNFPPSGPEHATPDPYEFFEADNIEEMRQAQKEAREEELQNVDPFNPQSRKEAEARAAARYDQIRYEYMMDFDFLRQFDGMPESDPAYAEYEDIIDHLGQVSIDQMNDDEWVMGQMDNNGDQIAPSGREMVQQIHDDELASFRQYEADQAAREAARRAAAATPPPPSPNNDPTIVSQEMRQEIDRKIERGNILVTGLDEARDKLATLSVERQGKMGGKASPEFKKAYNDYQAAMIEYGRFREEMLGDRRSDNEKNTSAIGYLLKEGTALRELTNAKWEDTKVGKFCKFMAKGNFAQRVAKGVGVGLVVAGGTAIITAATAGTGTVGVVAGGGATVATLASRIMRGYGSVRGRQGGMAQELTPQEATELATLVARNSIDTAGQFIMQKYEATVDNERQKNKKAALWSLGAVALGAGGAEVAHLAVEHGTDYTDKLASGWDRIRGMFGHHPDKPTLVSPHEGSDGNGTGTGPDKGDGTGTTPDKGDGTGTGPDKGGDGVNPPVGGEETGTGSNIADHLTPKQLQQFEAMSDIDPGMGGIQLFKELGLSQSDWYQHEQALLKAHPGDFYKMPDGHVGLMHPGKLSEGAMIDIAHRTGIWKG